MDDESVALEAAFHDISGLWMKCFLTSASGLYLHVCAIADVEGGHHGRVRTGAGSGSAQHPAVHQ